MIKVHLDESVSLPGSVSITRQGEASAVKWLIFFGTFTTIKLNLPLDIIATCCKAWP